MNSIGRSGGLAILWKHPFDCEILNYSQHFINIKASQGGRPVWRLTCFYGCPESERRRESWNILRTLATDISLPWCVIGDFNDLLSNEEKRGRCDHPLWKIRGFREAVTDCQLTNLVLEGHQFTWSKGRGIDDFKERKLDRAMASHDWFNTFPNYRLCNTVIDRSDHSPILLLLYGEGRRRRRRSFKFENSWLEEDSLEEVVERGWGVGAGSDIVNRLKTCTEEMNVWGRSLRPFSW